MNKLIYSLAAFLAFPSAIMAAQPLIDTIKTVPQISGVSGRILDNNNLDILGDSFGSKESPLPILWDDFENGVVGEHPVKPLIGNTNWGEGENVVYTNTVTRPGSTRSSRHDFYSNYRAALKFAGGPWGKLYVSWYYRTDYKDLTIYNGFPTRNYKVVRFEGDNGTKTGDQHEGVPLIAYELRGVGDTGAFETALRAQYSPVLQSGTYYGSSIKWAHQTWSRIEMYLNVVDGQKEYKIWENSIDKSPSKSSSAWENCFSPYFGGDNSRFNELFFGIYFSKDNGASAYLYMDDIYIDTSQARVELGNSPEWEKNTHREIQIPTNWTDNKITIKLNTGSFNNYDEAYLYVIDADGRTNRKGHKVIIGK